MKRLGPVLALVFAVGACAVDPAAHFPDVAALVADRGIERVHWLRGGPEDAEVEAEITRLLRAPLTIETAVEIALLHNRHLQARFEELGIAEADLVQAGLLDNPQLGGTARPHIESAANVEADVALGFNLLGAFTLAARRTVASERLQRTIDEMAHAVLTLAVEVRIAFRRAQAAEQLGRVDKTIADAAEASFDAASALRVAGNVSELQLAEEQAQYEQARLTLAQSDARVAESRETLHRLLGVWGHDITWTLAALLPPVPAEEIALGELEGRAVGQRLDLAAAKADTAALVEALGLERDVGWLTSADLGASATFEADGLALGPSLGLSLPIFDQGQAKAARAEAHLRASYQRVTALAVDIRSAVRESRDKLVRARRMAEHYRDVVIPLRERIVALTLREYDFMLVGVFDLLRKKQLEADAYRAYIEAVRDYWIARAELEGAVGGALPLPTPPSPAPVAPAEAGAPGNAPHHVH